MDWLKNRPIAHRGLHSNDSIVPENSLKAFQKAIEGAYPIELDIHLLADSKIAVFHDESLKRMCHEDAFIQDIHSEDLDHYRLLDSQEKIPLLQEVFEAVRGQVPILIEIKEQKRNTDIQPILFDMMTAYQGQFAIQSFNPLLLQWFVENAPTIPRGQLLSNIEEEKMKSYFRSQPHFIGCDVESIFNKTVQIFRKEGLPVLCWTVKNLAAYKRVASFCDNIIFEGFEP